MNSARALADHSLKIAGIAAVIIGPDGEVTVCGTIGIDLPSGWACFGCLAGDIDRVAGLARRWRGDQAEVAAQLEQLAADHFIGLSRHADVASARCTPSPWSITGSRRCRHRAA